MMKYRLSHCLSLLIAVTLLCACSASKDLAEGDYMLNKVQVVSDAPHRDINPASMKAYIRQKSNARWLSTAKVPLGIYAMAGADSSWLSRTLRSMGEAPVIFDTLLARQSCDDLRQALRNKGYLDAEVSLYIDKKRHKLNAIYVLHPDTPYHVRHLETAIGDTLIAALLTSRRPLLSQGMQFSADAMNAERSAITQHLTDHGYFRFHKEFITYQALKDKATHQVDLKLILHPYRQRRDGTDTLHSRYSIREIVFESGSPTDPRIHLRRNVLRENTFIRAGHPYSSTDLQNTYNHFGRLRAVRYTNISYDPVPDTTLLDAHILVQTNKPSTVSFQPEGTNTAGDLGAAASLTYQNRNLFRGSELLTISTRGAYEAIRGLEGYSNQDFLEYSVETSLSLPRFIPSFLARLSSSANITGETEVSLLYDSQDRPEFHRRVLSAGWHYQWQPHGQNSHYRVDLIDLNYVFMPWISETFRREYLDNTTNSNAILRYNYEDLFIMKLGFGYAFNNGTTALKTNLETSGNLLQLYTSAVDGPRDPFGQRKVFDIAFAQYVKADFDLTYQLLRTARSEFVFHTGFGIAYPYGNSRVLPFEKRYFAGGANGVRGWAVRSLGPGRYKDRDGRINFITQTGDLKLDLNLEYRAHLFWKFGGALFLDAGNVWTLRAYDDQPGGQFRLTRLPADLAVSYGFGLRLNFDYFVVRFDLGVKAINPAFETEDEAHYPLLHPDLNRDLAFHFAVGLPF